MIILRKPEACLGHLPCLKLSWKSKCQVSGKWIMSWFPELLEIFILSSHYGGVSDSTLLSLFLSSLSHPPLSVRRKPRVQLHVPFQTIPAVNLLTCTALTVTGTTAAAPQAPGCLLCPLQAQPVLPGHSVHATNQLAWPYVSKRKRKTRGAKSYQTAMNSLQTYKTRR